MTVFNKEFVDYHKEPMFFGESLNISRFENPPRPIFDTLDKHMRSLFWTPEEINLSKDVLDWQNMNKAEKFIFTENLSYQTLLDSVAERSGCLAFLPHVSDPSLETCILTWGFFESIHSRSYSYIIRNVFPNPVQTFDDIMFNQKIIDRAISVTEHIDIFIAYSKRWERSSSKQKKIMQPELKRLLYLCLIAFNALEGVRFYVSFCCSWAMNENKKMEGSSKIISLIQRDEAQHLSLVQHIFKQYRKEDPEMLEIMESCIDDVYNIYKYVVDGEKDWANHLFQHGTILGLNAEILHQYIEYIANQRLRGIGLKPIFNHPWNQNPLPWTNTYTNSGNVQSAPQEVELISYISSGSLDNTINDDDFDDFDI